MKTNVFVSSYDLGSIFTETVNTIWQNSIPITTNGFERHCVSSAYPITFSGYSKADDTFQQLLDLLKTTPCTSEDVVNQIGVKAPNWPITDLYLEENGTMRIEVAITKFDPDDISIRGVGTKLIIKGVVKDNQKKQGTENERKIYGKIKHDDFELSYECGEIYDTEKAEASVSRGLLIVRVPLKEENTPKKFSINIKK